jgi:hypothetical protein
MVLRRGEAQAVPVRPMTPPDTLMSTDSMQMTGGATLGGAGG